MMNLKEDTVEQEEFRILCVSQSRMVMAELKGGSYRLPRVVIPRWTRISVQLSRTLQTQFGVSAIILDFLPRTGRTPRCALAEIRSGDWNVNSSRLMAIELHELAEEELNQSERLIARDIFAGNHSDLGPFARMGWIEEAQGWIRESVSGHLVEFNKNVYQSSAGGSFALVRFGTIRGPAYWLKATGTLHTHELGITTTLAYRVPEYVPPFIAARLDWNAWVTEEMGHPLHETLDIAALEASAHCLGGIQCACMPYVSELVAKGCFDQRIPTLRANIPRLMLHLEEIMLRQTSVKVAPMSAGEMSELKKLLERACDQMEYLTIPDSLVHNDLTLSNILFDGERAYLIDWAEASVGNPFLTFQHLLAQASTLGQTRTSETALTNIYARYWRDRLSDSTIAKALALAPPLAIASYMIGRGSDVVTSNRGDSRMESFSRSLARHMNRAAQTPEFLEAVCH